MLMKIVHETRIRYRNGCATSGISLAAVHGGTTMTLLRALLTVLLFAMIAAVSHEWTRAAVQRNVVIAPPPLVDTTSVLDASTPALHVREDEDWLEPRVDLNGNEIDAAIGDYRVDPRGEMYERHAPDTALLHLSAPKL
jgi:hypothetical protein